MAGAAKLKRKQSQKKTPALKNRVCPLTYKAANTKEVSWPNLNTPHASQLLSCRICPSLWRWGIHLAILRVINPKMFFRIRSYCTGAFRLVSHVNQRNKCTVLGLTVHFSFSCPSPRGHFTIDFDF